MKVKIQNNIEWTNQSWNVASGCDHHGDDLKCAVWRDCWAHSMALRQNGRNGYPSKPDHFNPTTHADKLDAPYHWRKRRVVAVCLMADLFCGGFTDEYIKKIIKVVRDNPTHIFAFLTKSPENAQKFTFPDNAWVGTTINRIIDKTRIYHLKKVACGGRFISFEPVFANLRIEDDCLDRIHWVIIGAKTGAHPFQPKWAWVQNIVENAHKAEIPVLMKNNLEVMPELFEAEYPEAIAEIVGVEA